ncbi:nucleotidyltransferase domain-containing protein [bacterium]|nr:nucleotidyltransferase domain-containing protein [bacterium]
MLSIFWPDGPIVRHADKIIAEHDRRFDLMNDKIAAQTKVLVDGYAGRNPAVHTMQEYLSANLKDDVVGAYVHGSVATGEEIPYSDFDALVILKDRVFQSKKVLVEVARKLNLARSIMFDFDPLQHHGWFVLSEVDLTSYPYYYYPVELFQYTKSLFNDVGTELKLGVSKSCRAAHKAFDGLCRSILATACRQKYPKNMYELKSLLSQFMLLPTFYVQLRDKKGVYKKCSFDAARSDFCSLDWTVMDEASMLRTEWSVKMSSMSKSWSDKPTWISRLAAKRLAPTIPDHYCRILNQDFYRRMVRLVNLMQARLQ